MYIPAAHQDAAGVAGGRHLRAARQGAVSLSTRRALHTHTNVQLVFQFAVGHVACMLRVARLVAAILSASGSAGMIHLNAFFWDCGVYGLMDTWLIDNKLS